MQKFFIKLNKDKPTKGQLTALKKLLGKGAEVKEVSSYFYEVQVENKSDVKENILGKAKTNKWSFVNL